MKGEIFKPGSNYGNITISEFADICNDRKFVNPFKVYALNVYNVFANGLCDFVSKIKSPIKIGKY